MARADVIEHNRLFVREKALTQINFSQFISQPLVVKLDRGGHLIVGSAP